MLKNISLMLGAFAVLETATDASLRSSPLPGRKTKAHAKPMTIAKRVVTK